MMKELISIKQIRMIKHLFILLVKKGHIEIVKLLVNDQRIDINEDNNDYTPFWIACQNGSIEIVKHILASRVNLIIQNNIEKKEIINLLESFENDPNETRIKLRMELGFAGNNKNNFFFFKKKMYLTFFIFFIKDFKATSIYSIMVLLSDHYLNFKSLS